MNRKIRREHRFKQVQTPTTTNPAAARAKEEDQRWFAEQPSRLWRLRDMVPGELAPEWPEADPDTRIYVYRRPDGQIFRAPLMPQEYALIASGTLQLYPAMVDGVFKWVARTQKAN